MHTLTIKLTAVNSTVNGFWFDWHKDRKTVIAMIFAALDKQTAGK